jgi:antitoxin component of MazEF toxin-antitoxin module
MKTETLKLSAVGNSRGIRIPAGLIRRYGFSHEIVAEVRDEGLLLKKPETSGKAKLSWEETAKAMAGAEEDWSDFSTADSDGLDTLPWDPKE